MTARFLILAASLHCIQIRILWQFMSWKMLKGHWRKNTFNQYFRSRPNVWPALRTSQSSVESSSSTLKAALMVNSFYNCILWWSKNTMMILLSKCLLFPTDYILVSNEMLKYVLHVAMFWPGCEVVEMASIQVNRSSSFCSSWGHEGQS